MEAKTEMNLNVGAPPSTEELQKEHDDAVNVFKAIGGKAVKFELPPEPGPKKLHPNVDYLANEVSYEEFGQAIDDVKRENEMDNLVVAEYPIVIMPDGSRKALVPRWHAEEFEAAIYKIRCAALLEIIKRYEQGMPDPE
jgi:hypothetical protein